MHWTAGCRHTLHPTALHCTAFCALDYTTPTCYELHGSVIHCTIPQKPALLFALHCTVLDCTALHCIALFQQVQKKCHKMSKMGIFLNRCFDPHTLRESMSPVPRIFWSFFSFIFFPNSCLTTHCDLLLFWFPDDTVTKRSGKNKF